MSHCTHHCRACGGHFTSLKAFDAHRDGPMNDRRCTYPDDATLVERSGVCRLADQTSRLVTVCEHASAQAARTHFNAESPADGSQS